MTMDAAAVQETPPAPWVDAATRHAAHQALDRWLEECERASGDTFDSGRSGYIGRIKLCAFVDDEGTSLRIERSFSDGL